MKVMQSEMLRNHYTCSTLRSVTFRVFVLVLVVRSLETSRSTFPGLCSTGRRNTTGPNANTDYDVIKLEDCSKKRLPHYNCTVAPGSPKHVKYGGRGYISRLQWNVSEDAGGAVSTLKGFIVQVSVQPFDGTPFPWECYYINITRTVQSQYVLGTFYFQCNYTKESRVNASITSYPSLDMCHTGGITRSASILTFFVPFITEHADSTWAVSTMPTTSHPSITKPIIATVLTCSLVFVAILVSGCVWNKFRKGKNRFPSASVVNIEPSCSNTSHAYTTQVETINSNPAARNNNDRDHQTDAEDIPTGITELKDVGLSSSRIVGSAGVEMNAIEGMTERDSFSSRVRHSMFETTYGDAHTEDESHWNNNINETERSEVDLETWRPFIKELNFM